MTRIPTRIAVPALALTGLLVAPPTEASKEIARQEGNVECATCHVEKGKAPLTDRGKYYEATGDLDGFAELEESFERCTHCHVSRPGSDELTEVGERYRWMMVDMKGIREWLLERHLDPDSPPTDPRPSESEGPEGNP